MPTIPLTIRVRPGSSRTRVGGAYAEPPQLVVAVTAPAVDGRANRAVLSALAKAVGVRPSSIAVVAGLTSRTKRVVIDADDASADRVRQRLVDLLEGG